VKIETCSEEFARLLEMTVEQTIESFNNLKADHDAIHPDERDAFAALEADALARGEGYTAEYRIVLPSGRIRHIREVCEVELDDQGKVIRSMGSIQDITEQTELQEQLRHAIKIKAIGQLTGGVAHDFNNLLMIIMGNVDLAISEQGKEHSCTGLLREALGAGEKGATLIRRLLAFSRKQSLQMKTVDVQGLILGMKDMLQRTLGETIEVEIQTTDQQWLSETDTTQLESAILNLAINARDAMPDGGSLCFKLDNVSRDENDVSGHEELKAGPYIQLSITDTGAGMPPEVITQVFEPFFTTKGAGEGTGLGLSTVYGFIKQCGGDVIIESEPEKGTTVFLLLPPDPDGTIERPGAPVIEASGDHKEHILIVEDDPDVRRLAVSLMDQLGYQTVQAENAKQALQLLRR
jgi:signal transduction histidine kinase